MQSRPHSSNPPNNSQKRHGRGDTYGVVNGGVVGGHRNLNFLTDDDLAFNANSPPPAHNHAHSYADHHTPLPQVTGDSYDTVNGGRVGGRDTALINAAMATQDRLRQIRLQQLESAAKNGLDVTDYYRKVNGGIVGGDCNIHVINKNK